MEDLSGKVAVVTGAASGIGRALADRFATEGMRLVLADVEEAALETAAGELAAGGADVLAVPTDVSDAGSVSALAATTFERCETAHIVCNNAGVGGTGHATWDGPLSAWEWVLGVNLWGVVHGIRAFVPRLVEQDEGHVVNTGSLASLAALPNMGPYTTSKHGVLGVSEALAHELALRGSAVGVSVLCPGFVRTRIMDSERNWPDRLGPAPARSDDPVIQLMDEVGRTAIAAGLPPGALADLTVAAVRTRRFMVLPDEHAAAAAVAVRAAEVEGGPPTLPPLTDITDVPGPPLSSAP